MIINYLKDIYYLYNHLFNNLINFCFNISRIVNAICLQQKIYQFKLLNI